MARAKKTDPPATPDVVILDTPPTDGTRGLPDAEPVEAAPTESPVETPATEATPTPEAADAPKEEPPPGPVIVTFARPPADVETAIRETYARPGKDLIAVRDYRAWVNGREGVGTEGGPPKLGLLEAQDAVRWLVAQPPIEPEPVEGEPTPAPIEGQVIDFPAPPRREPPPIVVAPVRTKILATMSIQHEYQLTDEERLAFGSALANLQADIENESAAQSDQKRRMKAKLDGLKGEQARVADIMRRGAEVRTIPVVDIADYELREVITQHEDTLEIIRRRPLDPHEAQIPLFGALKPAAEPIVEEAADPFVVDEEDVDEEQDGDPADE